MHFRRGPALCLSLRGRWRLWNTMFVLLTPLFLLFLSTFWHRPSTLHRTHLPVRVFNRSLQNYALKTECKMYTCFEISRCVFSLEDTIGVYVGDWYDFSSPITSTALSPPLSTEYSDMIRAVKESRYYVSDPSQACVFIPAVDTLKQGVVDAHTMSSLLNSLPEWDSGQNYLIFSMLPGDPSHFNSIPDYYYGKAMLANAGTTPDNYRMDYDISIPVFNPLTWSNQLPERALSSERQYLLTVIDHGGFEGLGGVSRDHVDKDVLLLHTACRDVSVSQLPRRRCGFNNDQTYSFPDILLNSKFCLLLSGAKTGMLDFTDMLMTGCIPVTTADVNLPFFEVLDWALASISCPSCDLPSVVRLLRQVPQAMVGDWRQRGLFFYRQYFSSMATIAMITLDILNQRVFPITARSYEWWNTGQDVSHTSRDLEFLPPPKQEGFTTVILTYNRVPSLFKVIESVAEAPSCVRFVVIWNNVEMAPPPAKEWPRIKQPIQVIRSRENKLSNRFYPYDNLTTAILSLDDDITMLTVDELEFGFKAWQEFPNRLVGFPSRVHIKLPTEEGRERWKYESEWLNNISLVLTGAAFYHKYYNYLYTHEMPRQIRDWVDQHMNCEDIAMNFLVSNYTGLPPLKVSPRKKFVCPGCSSEQSLWTDPLHYRERDECINIFEHFFGGMPLQAVKFRLDPVLYKTNTPQEMQAYPKMGEL